MGYVYFTSNSNDHSGNTINGLYLRFEASSLGGINYQNLNSSDFYPIKSDINQLNSNFDPTNIFRITYDNVSKYQDNSQKATFQIILATDSLKSYVVLKYSSCLSNDPLRVLPGIYFLGESGQQLSNLLTDPCNSLNINQNGTWVFDVTTFNGNYIIDNETIYTAHNKCAQDII